MSSPPSFGINQLRFEHFQSGHQLGSAVTRPRLSWKYENAPPEFIQLGYTLELYEHPDIWSSEPICQVTRQSHENVLVPWPGSDPLKSRQRVFARVKAWGEKGEITEWSKLASIEAGLLDTKDWAAERITAPWQYSSSTPQPEELFRKEFSLHGAEVKHARLYITAQGVYEAEINGRVVGDHFLAPGWTVYDRRLQYQTYDVTDLLSSGSTCDVLGVRLAEGWFCGRFGFDGGKRNIWGERPALIAQLEVYFADGRSQKIVTDHSWVVCHGPTRLAEIYDGEKYDARKEVLGWSSHPQDAMPSGIWNPVKVDGPMSSETRQVPQEAEPVRRIEVLRPLAKLSTPSRKIVLDFGQNIVGYTRIKQVRGESGNVITISHAEVMEHNELGRRPLREAANIDTYTLKGDSSSEAWEPRFTFHGFRYVQIDGWPSGEDEDIMNSIEAVVCHTDMDRVGDFQCSNELLNKLYQNVIWSMRGNFLSIPTDCPQRDERLGWTGDIAIFAPTACLIYDATNMLRNWLEDLHAEQAKHNGIPPVVVPYILEGHPIFGWVSPCAIWCDAAILVPWALYQASGDMEILRSCYASMKSWLSAIPKNTDGNVHLWKDSHPQLGDWLDPSAPADKPNQAQTDAVFVSNAYLIRSLDILGQVARLLDCLDEAEQYGAWCKLAKQEFAHEYISPNGRLMSDAQTAYTVAIAFDLMPTEKQRQRAVERFIFIVRRNAFRVGTGFAGTPLVCEALAKANQFNIAYAMLLNEQCPSWLYPVTKGATTIWERWDSMLADDSINPGEMTSFNHYALGAVASFLVERVAGLSPALPGWKSIKIAPLVGGDVTNASSSIETLYGKASSSWRLEACGDTRLLHMEVLVPPNTDAEIIFPEGSNKQPVRVKSGFHQFSMDFTQLHEWPVEALRPY